MFRPKQACVVDHNWTNSNCGSAIHMLKLAFNWKPPSLTNLIEKHKLKLAFNWKPPSLTNLMEKQHLLKLAFNWKPPSLTNLIEKHMLKLAFNWKLPSLTNLIEKHMLKLAFNWKPPSLTNLMEKQHPLKLSCQLEATMPDQLAGEINVLAQSYRHYYIKPELRCSKNKEERKTFFLNFLKDRKKKVLGNYV